MTDYVTIPMNKNINIYDSGKNPFKNNNPPKNKPKWSINDYNKYNCETPPEFYEIFENMQKTINKNAIKH